MTRKNILKRVLCKLRHFFSEVFKRHAEDEAEQVVIVGAIGTIPDPETLTSECPRPWLYTRVLLFFVLTTALLFVANMLTNPGQFSNVMVVGAFAVPFTTLTLLFELNVFRNISFYTVLKALFIGGAMSLIVTSVLPSFWFLGLSEASDAFAAGIGEEIAKMLVVYWILKRNRAYPYILNGLLVGAAVGAGFAIFETAGYAMGGLLVGNNEWLGRESMLILFLRNALAPGGHVVWAAMSGAGMLLAMRREPLSPAVFGRWRFWLSFLFPVVLHVLWDLPLLWKMPAFDSEWTGLGFCVVLTMATWGVVAWFLRRGLKEVDTPHAVILWHGTPAAPPDPAGGWRRWAARYVDLYCGVIVASPVLLKCFAYFGVEGAFDKLNDVIAGVVAIPVSLMLEAVVFNLFGTTFGKWAFSIRVRDADGHPVASRMYFLRLVRLWASGLGFGLPFVSFIAHWIQYCKVRSGFNATYDESLGLRVDKGRFHPLRWIVVLPVLIVVVGLTIVEMSVGEDETEPKSPTHADGRLERLVSSAGLKCDWTENGVCVIPFETSETHRRMQTCLAFFETVASSGAERLFICSMAAKCDAVGRSELEEILAANATMDNRQWCKVDNDLTLRAFLPVNVSPQEFRDVAARLAEDADSFENRLTGKDEF